MDLLSLAVEEMRLQRAEYRSHALPARASLELPGGHVRMHVIEAGQVTVALGRDVVAAGPGDVLLFPGGIAQTIRASDSSAALVSGRLSFEAFDHPLLAVLPRMIHATPALIAGSPRLGDYVRHLVAEVRDARDGADVLVTRLTDVLFIEVMRFFSPPPGVECPVGGFFGALNDAPIRRVLLAIHEAPGKPWTVASLAGVAGESRSAFAAHFALVMKEPPMAYLSRWRMFRGRNLLRRTDMGLSRIAEQLGYGSAAAFSQAFTREHGVTPGAYRENPHPGVPAGADLR